MLVICKVSNAAVGKLGPLCLMHHIDTGVLVQLPAARYDFCATQHNATWQVSPLEALDGLKTSLSFPSPAPSSALSSSASPGSDVLQKCFKKPQRVNSAPKVNRNELTLPEFSALDGRAALRLQAARVTTINKSIPSPATHTHGEKANKFLAKGHN